MCNNLSGLLFAMEKISPAEVAIVQKSLRAIICKGNISPSGMALGKNRSALLSVCASAPMSIMFDGQKL